MSITLRSAIMLTTRVLGPQLSAVRIRPVQRLYCVAPVAGAKSNEPVVTKSQLVEKLAIATATTKKDADRALNALINIIQDSVSAGERVTITGFGTFEARQRAARKGRNPLTQEELQIPATVAPKFSPGKVFKDTVKGIKREPKEKKPREKKPRATAAAAAPKKTATGSKTTSKKAVAL